MAKVITFAQTFQGKHPRKGEETNFTEAILQGLGLYKRSGHAKYHTFRAGYNWHLGDDFSPRYWSGLPYRSVQQKITKDLQIKLIWDLEFDGFNGWYLNGRQLQVPELERIANNDGLELEDFLSWFPSPIAGQIICWADHIEY